MLIVTIIVAMFGITNVFAEPTIDDLVAEVPRDFGTFKPNVLYDDTKVEEIVCVSWLNTTQIFFSYDWWKDTSGDGEIDVEDVYSQPEFEQEMLLNSASYPVFDVGKDNDYYLVLFSDYKDFDGKMIQVIAAEFGSVLVR